MSASTGKTPSWNDQVMAGFYAGDKKVAERFDLPTLLLLHTTGARSGLTRTSPLRFFADGDRLLIVASAGGSDRHPSWYFNILAEPQVKIERWQGDAIEVVEATATPVEGAERELLWQRITSEAKGFAVYQENLDRVIPVVALKLR
jgi:deazaflavin-dependent oxidoreductase (nitroreductase family)